jgi:DNA-directed RNA polymerase specialized sigma24 family protein
MTPSERPRTRRRALDALVSIADVVYGLAVRMLWHPADAGDATQEILTKIVTNPHLRGDSSFKTWPIALRAITH